MPRRISTKRPLDVNQAAFVMVEKTTGTAPKRKVPAEVSRIMSAMGRKGGKIGGKKRLKSMTPEQRSQVALKAATTRWGRAKPAAIEQSPLTERGADSR
jgi:hypothetical protein